MNVLQAVAEEGQNTFLRYIRLSHRSSLIQNIVSVVFLTIFCVACFPAVCMAETPKKGDFLVASRELRDPNFYQTVVLLVGYDTEGSMGLVINRMTQVPISQVFPESEVLSKIDGRIYLGGPVSMNQFFILVQSKIPPANSLHLLDDLYLSDLTYLQGVLSQNSHSVFRVYAGYAGWGPGQLDQELARGDWHVLPGEHESVLSDDPSSLWQVLIERSTAVWALLFSKS